MTEENAKLETRKEALTQQAQSAAQLASSSNPVDVLTAAYYRFAKASAQLHGSEE